MFPGQDRASSQCRAARYCRSVSTEPLRCAGALIVDHDGLARIEYDFLVRGLIRRIAEEGFAVLRSIDR